MVRVHGAGTIPVNGPSEPFVLRRDQLWQALQRKIRHPEEFVPVLSSCTVHKDENGIVERDVVLDFGKWGTRPMSETVTSIGDLWVGSLDGPYENQLTPSRSDLRNPRDL